jgi:exodeoxyribonuclease-3
MRIKIASWNVNSLRVRLPHVQAWWRENEPDILCLQETKVEDSQFPHAELAGLAPHRAVWGQKSYNGVAILSRHPLTHIVPGMAHSSYTAQGQARFLSAEVLGLTVASAYVPNGEALTSPKFAYKEEFYHHLLQEVNHLQQKNPRLILAGDFNIAADERDVANPTRAAKDVLFTPTERAWLAALSTQALLVDSFRSVNAEPAQYSWWDYRTYGRTPNNGMRIDYIWVSQALQGQIRAASHSSAERAKPQPSDHVPVVLELDV